jgi:hypothetical protein
MPGANAIGDSASMQKRYATRSPALREAQACGAAGALLSSVCDCLSVDYSGSFWLPAILNSEVT